MTRKDIEKLVEAAIKARYDMRRKPRSGYRYAVVVTDDDIFATELPTGSGDVVWRKHIWTFPLWRGEMHLKAWRELLKRAPAIIAMGWNDNTQEWDKKACLQATYTLERLAEDLYFKYLPAF